MRHRRLQCLKRHERHDATRPRRVMLGTHLVLLQLLAVRLGDAAQGAGHGWRVPNPILQWEQAAAEGGGGRGGAAAE